MLVVETWDIIYVYHKLKAATPYQQFFSSRQGVTRCPGCSQEVADGKLSWAVLISVLSCWL